ncbi:MAG: CoA-binding protein [Chloroflexi bacterium]|nr:CoA-binding protein [Chloroflexota bacterium]
MNDIFHPRSIAVVGATGSPGNVHTQMFLGNLLECGYKGTVYPINPKFEQIAGLKAYPSILQVPGPVDHVTSLIPASATPQLMKECAAKQVQTLQLFTAGFAETGEEEGRGLQAELVKIARGGGVRIIGPNCVGLYCPQSGISFSADFPRDAGKVAFIAQSGSYVYLTVRMGASRGIRFSKVVGYGNASDVNEIDLLDFLASDPDTEIVGAYIEGTRDGRQLLRVLAKAAARKPVIVIKKGCTQAGIRGASSHTGTLAGSDAVWETALKQTGAIRVGDVEEMVDLMATFLFLGRPPGKNAVVVGPGGGISVRASDECETGGLTLPPVSEELRTDLRRSIPLAGSMLRNPIDLLAEPGGDTMWLPVLRSLDKWEAADVLIWQVCPEVEPLRTDAFGQFIIRVRQGMLEGFAKARKPKAVVVHAVETRAGLEELDAIRGACAQRRIPFYPSMYRASLAISRCVDYHNWKDSRA